MIELKKVYKKFDNHDVLKNISFTVKEGEIFVIIGLSGTGKTVTLRHIAGLEEPDKGEILIDGVRMNGASNTVKAHLRKKMGVVC